MAINLKKAFAFLIAMVMICVGFAWVIGLNNRG